MEKFQEFPGINFNFSQLIRDNVEEALSGVKGANSVKLFGNDLKTLEEAGQRVANILKTVPGIENVGLFHIVGQPNLEIEIDRDAVRPLRHQRRRRRGGRPGGHRRPGVLADGRGGEALRHRPPAAARARATTPTSSAGSRSTLPPAATASPAPRIPLAAARQDRPAQARGVVHLPREQPPVHPDQVQRPRPRPRLGHRRGPAEGRRPEDRRPAARRATRSSGRASSRRCRRPTRRLMWIVPLSIGLIMVLLYTAFNSIKDALLVMVNVVAATMGGVWALWLTGTPFSISAAVGFISVFGVAVQDGVLLISYFNQMRAAGLPGPRGGDARRRAAGPAGGHDLADRRPGALARPPWPPRSARRRRSRWPSWSSAAMLVTLFLTRYLMPVLYSFFPGPVGDGGDGRGARRRARTTPTSSSPPCSAAESPRQTPGGLASPDSRTDVEGPIDSSG